LIAALAVGTLVVEAAPRSGSLITARLANELGRDVFAMPGSIHAPLAQGCHALIRDGAKLTATPLDVLEEYGLGEPAAQAGGAAADAGCCSNRHDASAAAAPRAGERRTGAAASPGTDTAADARSTPPRTACAPANDPAERAVL
ncbi:DNA-processing protein DprA, partial [Burkholderia gladioli]